MTRRDLLLRSALAGAAALMPCLAAEFAAILALPEVVGDLADQGFTVTAHGPDRFAALVQAEAARWPGVVRQTGARLE
ncbi:MAG TPA: hypothetical protein VN329_00505 [Roseomonas sp.]|nr:hypothetical protein [Roseomonas sp.]